MRPSPIKKEAIRLQPDRLYEPLPKTQAARIHSKNIHLRDEIQG